MSPEVWLRRIIGEPICLDGDRSRKSFGVKMVHSGAGIEEGGYDGIGDFEVSIVTRALLFLF